MKRLFYCLTSALTALMVFGASGSAMASEAFYKGKTLRIIVSFAPGGGYDLLARLMSRLMPNYIPGKPSIIVQNMAGAGGTVAGNYLYNVVKDEVLTIGILHSSQAISQLTNETGIRFEIQRFKWIGAVGTGPYVLAVRRDLAYGNIEEFRTAKKPLYIAASRPGESNFDYPAVLTQYGNINLKLVKGYRGTKPISIALEKGEVDGGAGSLPTVMSQYPKNLKIVIGNAGAKDTVPDIILDKDVVKSKEGRELIDALSLPQEFSKGIIAPPDFPAEGLADLRKAWSRLIKDQKFLDEMAKLIMAEPGDFVASDRVNELLEELFSLPGATWKRLIDVRKLEAVSKRG